MNSPPAIGYLVGPILGATLAPVALGQQILESLYSGVGRHIQLISGLMILALVLFNHDGVAAEQVRQIGLLKQRLGKGGGATGDRAKARSVARLEEAAADTDIVRVPPRRLTIEGLTVRYGGTVAVNDVSLTVTPGSSGPNGAGKTSLIDAISGFTAAQGRLDLDGVDLSRLSAARRARAGVTRSFQSLELCDLVPELNRRGVDDITLLAPPGFGAPVPDGFGGTRLDHRDWLVSELEAIGEPVDLVGHDWGAGHVYAVAAARPDLLRSWSADCAGLVHPDYEWHPAAAVWQTEAAGEESIAAIVAMTGDEIAGGFGVPERLAPSIAEHLDQTMGQAILRIYRSAPLVDVRGSGSGRRRTGVILVTRLRTRRRRHHAIGEQRDQGLH